MRRYVIRRLMMAVPLLLAISFICFLFINLIPSNPAEVALRVQQMPVITEEAIARMEEMLGLNKPFLIRYFDWLAGCLQGDFGISYVNPKRNRSGRNFKMPSSYPAACGGVLCDCTVFEYSNRIFVCSIQGWLV